MAHSLRQPVYPVGNPVHVDGHPYQADSGYVNTVIIDGDVYVVLVDVLCLFGDVEEIKNIRVQPPGIRTELINIRRKPPYRQLIPLTMLRRTMSTVRARIDGIDEAQMEDTTSSEEDPDSEDEDFIESDNESPEKEASESEEEEEAEFTSSSSSESESESDEEEELPGRKRHASSTSQRPSKSAKH